MLCWVFVATLAFLPLGRAGVVFSWGAPSFHCCGFSYCEVWALGSRDFSFAWASPSLSLGLSLLDYNGDNSSCFPPGAVEGLCREPGMRLGLQEPFLQGKLEVTVPCFSPLGENTDSWKLSICPPPNPGRPLLKVSGPFPSGAWAVLSVPGALSFHSLLPTPNSCLVPPHPTPRLSGPLSPPAFKLAEEKATPSVCYSCV